MQKSTLSKMSETKTKPRVYDLIVSWTCATGTSEKIIPVNVPFTFEAVEAVRISYNEDYKKVGYSSLYCSDIFGSADPIGTFADASAAVDSGVKSQFYPAKQTKGSISFRWNNPGVFIDRTGNIFVHLRFYEKDPV